MGLANRHEVWSRARRRFWLPSAFVEDILDMLAGAGNVRITVDDGNASDVDILLPLLLKRGLKATFFLSAGMLGDKGRVGHDGVRELVRQGMKIGTHGVHHHNWRLLSDQQLDDEVRRSIKMLCDLTGKPIDQAACPYGEYDRRVLRHLRQACLASVYTSDRGLARCDAWLQPRNSIYSTHSLLTIRQLINRSPIGPEMIICALKSAIKRLR